MLVKLKNCQALTVASQVVSVCLFVPRDLTKCLTDMDIPFKKYLIGLGVGTHSFLRL